MSEDQQTLVTDQHAARSEASVTAAIPAIGKMLMVGPRLQATVLKTYFDRQRQAIAFLSERTADGLKFADAVSSANTPTEVLSACSDFVQTGFRHFAEQSGEIGRQAVEALQTAQRDAANIAAATTPRHAA
ncbi:phasin family protein [Sphingomonas sp. H39-1-10]|uniref:phasin family protein n=1 Tax=Sphingomonas TaxID=13687 RepID=UPI0008851760|nr:MULTISPECIES: phasin family protein [Sphingomonas]MDF0487544.1 phasin family protein [Sphingomonas pollutisoli]SDA16525.1 Phasin protein [Sphingomonas sp. NFR15]